jgi:hypothetical protein
MIIIQEKFGAFSFGILFIASNIMLHLYSNLRFRNAWPVSTSTVFIYCLVKIILDRATAMEDIIMVVLFVGIIVHTHYFLEKQQMENFQYRKTIEKHKEQLAEEKQMAENLLLSILPRSVIHSIQSGKSDMLSLVKQTEASVLVADLVSFTTLCSTLSAATVVSYLNTIFACFDDLVVQHNLCKIKTLGDAYIVAANVDVPNSKHAEALIAFGLEMIKCLENLNVAAETGNPVRCRVGIWTGTLFGK